MRTKRFRAIFCWTMLVGALAVTISTTRAQQDANTGMFWLGVCTEESSELVCASYLMGLDDLHTYAGAAIYCVPKGVKARQVHAVVVKFLKDHPEKLHEPFVSLALAALRIAFPCRKISN